jgi:hypothetical protein
MTKSLMMLTRDPINELAADAAVESLGSSSARRKNAPGVSEPLARIGHPRRVILVIFDGFPIRS